MSYSAATYRNFVRFLPGYRELDRSAKTRISEFSLVWQLFERQHFQNNATAQKVRVDPWFGEDQVQIMVSAHRARQYFIDRYVEGENSEARLGHLIGNQGANLRNCIVEGLVREADTIAATRACGAVCMRLRNNLFHGVKANYGYRDQKDNFKHGIIFMNSCIATRP